MAKKSVKQLLADDRKLKTRIDQRTRAIKHTSGVLHTLDTQRRNAHLSDDDRRDLEKQYQEEKRRMANLRTGMEKDLRAEKKIEDQIRKFPRGAIEEAGR